MAPQELLAEIKYRLQETYGDRLEGVVLYGSEARGDAGPESDIDLLVLLAGPVEYGRELDRILRVLYPLALEVGRRISAKPAPTSEYTTVDCPLYRNVHREGVRL